MRRHCMNYDVLSNAEFVTYAELAIDRYLHHEVPIPVGIIVDALRRLDIISICIEDAVTTLENIK